MEKLPRTFYILFVGTLVNRIGSFVVPLFAIFLTEQRGYSPTLAGLVCSLYGLGSFCSGLLGGQLADRLGRQRTMLLSLVWGGIAMLLVPLSIGPITVALASFHLGLAGDLYRPAMQAAVADLVSPAQRPRAYGLLYWAVNLGFGVAASIGGLLARRSFGLLFVIDAATTFTFAIVVALFVPETRPVVVADAPSGSWRDALGDRLLVQLVMTGVLVGVLFQQAQAALPVTLLSRGITPARYGLILGLNGVLIVVLQPFVAPIISGMRRTRALALAALLTGVGFAWNAWPFGIAGAVTSVVLWTIGEILLAPIMPAILADLAPTHLRGRYQGISQMSWGICALAGPIGGMAIFERWGANVLWSSSLVLGMVAALLYLSFAGPLRARLDGRGAPA